MPKRSLSLLACLALGFGAVGVGCKRPADDSAAPATAAAKPPLHVETAKVEELPMPRYLALTGSLVANQQSDLAADATGKVLSTEVDRGSLVKKGDLLVRLDARAAALSSSEAAAMSRLAVAQQKLADEECERSRRLLASGAISQAEFDRTSSQCQTSKLSAAAAEARLNIASKPLGDAYIRAPYGGLIAERYVSVGEYVRPDSKVATLVEIDPLRLQMTVPEANVPAVRLGQKVSFGVSAYPDVPFEGVVKYVGPSVRGASRDLVVEAVVDNKDHKLRPGMFVTAKLDLGEKPMPAAPKKAVRTDGTMNRVFVVVGTQGDKRVEERLVQLGESKGDLVAILDGAKAGEEVVLEPPESLSDGQRVE